MSKTLTETEAAQIKGMLQRGDRQHNIAACFGVNSGRIAEINTGQRFASVSAAPETDLPPPGPYRLRDMTDIGTLLDRYTETHGLGQTQAFLRSYLAELQMESAE